MNILLALHHHLTKRYPYKWELIGPIHIDPNQNFDFDDGQDWTSATIAPHTITTNIITNISKRCRLRHHITITQDDNILTITQQTGPGTTETNSKDEDDNPCQTITTIDLLDPEFLTKIHQTIEN